MPYPANYGGVIDIFYKLKALHRAEVEVYLHVYQYGREKEEDMLKKYTKKLVYYKRQTFKNPFIGSKPYIVNTRNGNALLDELCKDNAPILFEGLHCTYHLRHKRLKKRFKVVRTHNIEHHYYKHLEKSELSYFKKYFFRIEAEKLRKYESVLKHADLILAISPNDTSYLSKKYENVKYLQAFHSNESLVYPEEKGDFLLYHGNLSVPENYLAAMDLIKKVFSKLEVPCVIAGNKAPKELVALCANHSNVVLRTNLSTEDIHTLIKDAHINVLYTYQNTGIKLKLLNALYQGKFAVVNPLMVEGSGIENLCVVGKDFDEITRLVKEYLLLGYSASYFENRKAQLEQKFDNNQGAQALIDMIDFSGIDKPTRKRDNKVLNRLSQLSLVMSYFSL